MLAVRLAQVSACLRTLDGQAPAVYQALAASLAWKPAADPSASRSAYQSQKCCLSTGGLRAQTSKLPSGPSSGAWSCGTSQRSFAADATPSSSEADQINPLLQAPSPGTAGSLGRPSDTAQAILRGAAISPKKLNHFASVVRGLHVEDALIQCKASPLKAADMTHRVWLVITAHRCSLLKYADDQSGAALMWMCLQLLQSAKANATNNHGLSADKLYVGESSAVTLAIQASCQAAQAALMRLPLMQTLHLLAMASISSAQRFMDVGGLGACTDTVHT